MTKFGENLMRYRRKAGLTQEALAEALGVSRQAVGKWESGATVVFFLGGFLLNGWAWSWIAFPIGGMLCAAVSNLKK